MFEIVEEEKQIDSKNDINDDIGQKSYKGFELNDPFPLLVEDSADIIKFLKTLR